MARGGLLYLWGYGAYGQLGFGFDDLRQRRAHGLTLDTRPVVVAVAGGWSWLVVVLVVVVGSAK